MVQSGLTQEMQPLADMLGHWECSEVFHAGGFVPEEMRAQGTDRIVVGPGGKSILADYQSEGAFGVYRAHDVITWDPTQNGFAFFFVDSFTPGFQLHGGRRGRDSVVFSGPAVVNGRPGTLRRVYTLSADTQSLVVDFADGGGAVVPLVTILKTRR